MKIPADCTLQFTELPELPIVILRLIDFKFHKFMNIVAYRVPSEQQITSLKHVEMIVDVIDKVIQVTG